MRVLVLYHAHFTCTPTISHYLEAIPRYSAHQVEFFNIDQAYDAEPDFAAYDVLFVNFCVASIARVPEPPRFFIPLTAGLRRFAGLKIAAVQDEYDFTHAVKKFLEQIGASVILTNVPTEAVRQVYPEPAFDKVRFESVQTAYLAEDLLESDDEILPLARRPIILGYRGRELPFRLGELGWHKAEVGHRFQAACARQGIPCDIAVDERSRFQGDAWMQFVRRCRVMLGTESGANVFDFDGSLHRRMVQRFKASPGLRYEDVREEIAAHEVGFHMGQVSARIFEAVVARTALALVRGSYSGVLNAEEHYLPIDPDYSNVDQVLARLLDVPAMQAMADRAYAHVIGNPANSYRGMVQRIDNVIDDAALQTERAAGSKLRVTSSPLGNDPYLIEQMVQLRDDLARYKGQVTELVKLAAEKRLEVVPYHGTYRVLKLPAHDLSAHP